MIRILALRHCLECGARRFFSERLFANDNELCDDCYFSFIDSVRERDEKRTKSEGDKAKKNAP